MARTLYRIYLYFVSLVLLIVASIGLGILLTNLLLQTPLHGQYESPPDKSSLVQQIVFAATALVVSLALGGLHYWLIRRDIAEDPNAARGAVRSLALNFAQAVTAIVALSTGTSALSDVGRNNVYAVSATAATAIVAVFVFVLLQLERGRSQPADGAPRALELIHLYLLQVILVTVAAIYAWVTAVSDSVTAIFASAGAIPNPCADQNSHYYVYPYNGPTGPGYQQPTCDFPSILAGEWLSLLWMAALLALYIWLARNDRDSVLRQIAHLLGFGVGAIITIIGIGQAVNFVLQGAFGAQSLSASVFIYHFNFIPPLLIGATVAWGHRFQLDRAAEASRMGRVGTNLTTLAVATLILGVPFYIGAVLVLQGLIERLVPGASLPDAATWAGDLSVLAAGIAYPVAAQLLRRNTTETAPIGPRRAIVLAGLAAGALMVAIGGVAGLYLVISAQLGSPIGDQWPAQARGAGAVVLVGLFLVGLHLYRLLTDRKPVEPARPVPPQVPTVPTPTIESVLDDLLAGRKTREQAAAQLRGMGVGQPSGR